MNAMQETDAMGLRVDYDWNGQLSLRWRVYCNRVASRCWFRHIPQTSRLGLGEDREEKRENWKVAQ